MTENYEYSPSISLIKIATLRITFMCGLICYTFSTMLHLVTLNMEGTAHLPLVTEFLTSTNPDCICLQEMPASYIYELTVLGYYPCFAPMMRDTEVSENNVLGVCIATKQWPNSSIHYYFGVKDGIKTHIPRDTGNAQSFPFVYTEITHTDGHTYRIATTHLMVTRNGLASPEQTASATALIDTLTPYPPHLLCGDFNMPRGYNTNYERFTTRYTDTIPTKYTSSLDRTLHRDGKSTDLNAPIFDIYMVDYIFTQSPYQVQDVQLHFGISDHAAVSAFILVS